MNRYRLLLAVLAGSVLLNVALAHRLRQWNRLFAASPDAMLQTGTILPPFQADDLLGNKHTVAYDQPSKPTVLYVFTPPCGWCLRNMDSFKALIAQKGSEYRFIGVSLSKEGLKEYVASHGLEFPVYSGLPSETQKTYKMGGTPQTIVISPQGRVVKNWMGAYVGTQKSDVENFFHISLPPVQTDTAGT